MRNFKLIWVVGLLFLSNIVCSQLYQHFPDETSEYRNHQNLDNVGQPSIYPNASVTSLKNFSKAKTISNNFYGISNIGVDKRIGKSWITKLPSLMIETLKDHQQKSFHTDSCGFPFQRSSEVRSFSNKGKICSLSN